MRIVAHVGEGMRGFLEFPGGRLAEGDYFDLATFMEIEVLDERDEVAVACHEHDCIELGCELHRIDREADVPVSFLRAIGEYLEVFRLCFDAHLGERVEEVLLFAAFGRDHIGDSAHEDAAADSLFEDSAEIHSCLIEVLRAVIKVLCVNEYADTLGWMLDNCHKWACFRRSFGRMK